MNYEPFTHVLGLELRFLDADTFGCSYTLMSRDGAVLSIVQEHSSTGPLVNVLANLPRKYPVALVISGRGIIHKNVTIESGKESEAFDQTFPSVERHEFYVQQFQEKGIAHVSIIRKPGLDNIISLLSRSGLKIIALSLGGVVAAHLLSQVSDLNGLVAIEKHRFSFNENGILDRYHDAGVIEDSFEFKIGGELIPDAQVIAYSAGFQVFLNGKLRLIKVNHHEVDDDLAYFLSTNKVKKQGFYFMLFLFAALLLSFVIFSIYNDKNLQLSNQVGQVTAAQDQVEMLNDNIHRNQAIAENLNWNGGYNYSYLVNEIGKTKPKELQLETLVFGYAKGEMATDQGPVINIKGNTNNLMATNNWIYLLKEMKWATSVKLTSYKEDSNTGQYKFEIKIFYQ